MEPYIIPILSFLGGGTVLAVVNWLISRRRSNLEATAMQDDHTKKWRDDALHLSDQMLDKEEELHAMAMKLHACLKARKDCPNCETI